MKMNEFEGHMRDLLASVEERMKPYRPTESPFIVELDPDMLRHKMKVSRYTWRWWFPFLPAREHKTFPVAIPVAVVLDSARRYVVPLYCLLSVVVWEWGISWNGVRAYRRIVVPKSRESQINLIIRRIEEEFRKHKGVSLRID